MAHATQRAAGGRGYAPGPLRRWIMDNFHGEDLAGPAGLAEQAGVSVSTLYRLLSGRSRSVHPGTADRILMNLGGRLDDVYPDEPDTCPSCGHKGAPGA